MMSATSSVIRIKPPLVVLRLNDHRHPVVNRCESHSLKLRLGRRTWAVRRTSPPPSTTTCGTSGCTRWTWSTCGSAVNTGRSRSRLPSRSGCWPTSGDRGLIPHLGVSTITPKQVAEARSVTDIVCVQNEYNLAHWADDALVAELARAGRHLRPVPPARRVHPAPVVGPRRDRQGPRGDADAGRATLAAPAVPEHPNHPRHVVRRPPPRERRAAALRLPPQTAADLDALGANAGG